MNHVFYKLANDAWIDVPDGGGYDGKIFSKERFAELIVQECITELSERHNPNFDISKFIQAGNPDPSYEMGLNDGLISAITILKMHFGVDS